MARGWGALIIIVVLAVIFALMAYSWLRRRRRQADLDGITAVPTEPGDVLLTDEVLYVATTPAEAPLERIAAGGLGFRARATLTVTEGGVILGIAGVPERWIAAADIRGADRGTWAIDRVVERDGLVLLGWRLAGTDVDTYLRPEHPEDLVAALRAITATAGKESA